MESILDPHFDGAGPFYDDAGAMRQLGCESAHELALAREAGEVLSMRAGDGTWLYPAWQADGDGRVREVLRPVLRALAGMEGWAAVTWLSSQHPDLDGASPRQSLRAGVDPEVVAGLAAHDRAMLTR